MRYKVIGIGVFILLFMAMAPLTVAAVTNTEILAIMNDVISGLLMNGVNTGKDILKAGEQAYCAANVVVFC